MNKLIPTEADEQKILIQWLRAKKIFHFAPANENNTYEQNPKYAMIAEQKAKDMGKLKGTSDLIVMLPAKILFIELKRREKLLKNGKYSTSHTKISKEQIDFLENVAHFYYADSAVCYGAEDAIEYISQQIEQSIFILRNMAIIA